MLEADQIGRKPTDVVGSTDQPGRAAMRQTSAEIDQGILDVASGIFAQHAYVHTSVQQVADAVGYSKAGLLHRFRSKEAIYLAAVESAERLVERIIAESADYPFDASRRARMLRLFAREAIAHPGMVQLVTRAFQPVQDGPGDDRIREVGYRLLALLDPPFATPTQRLRSSLGLQLIVSGALAHTYEVEFDFAVPPAELVDLVVELAIQVMDAPTAPVRSDS
jgi:AcrR family transcriptional regulator